MTADGTGDTPSPEMTTSDEAAARYRRQVLIVYVVAIFMTVIDGTMVNVALPTMADEFGVEANSVEWIAVGYLLAVATVIPAAGWLGDRFGTKRIFVLSLGAFTVVSLLCGIAQNLDQLVVLRVLQGLGGGLLTPVGGAMLYRAFPMNQRATAAGAVLSVAVVAPALGPLLGGILVDQASWRWIFYINLPIGAAGMLCAQLWLKEETQESPGRFDLIGLVLSGGSIAVLLYTLSIGPEQGWTSASVIALATVGVLGAIAAVTFELRTAEPILALRLLSDRLFRAINSSASLIYAGFFGFIFVLPIYLQSLRGYSAFESGLAQAPQAIGVLVVSNLFGQRAYRSIGPRRLMMWGSVAAGLVTCAYALMTLSTPLWVPMALSLVRGLSMGLVFISIQTAAYSTTSLADTGRATSLFNTQRQVSYAVGVALAATVLTAGLGNAGADRSLDPAIAAGQLAANRWAFLAVGLLFLPGAVFSSRIKDSDAAATMERAST